MKGRIVLIDHPAGKRDDRASRMLVQKGYAIEWRCPGKGDDLPEPEDGFDAAVVFGGPENLSEDDHLDYLRKELAWIERWIAADQPYLGLCLGAQMLARVMGARVAPHDEGWHEIGYARITPTEQGRDHGFMSEPMFVYHWHKEGFDLPQDAVPLASGEVFENQAFRYGKGAYGLQFHPEVTSSVVSRWTKDSSDSLKAPGAHPPERQLADCRYHDAPLERWFQSFLDRWLSE